MRLGISNATNHPQQSMPMVPVAVCFAVAGPVMQPLNIPVGQTYCSEVAEILGYPCAPMPLRG